MIKPSRYTNGRTKFHPLGSKKDWEVKIIPPFGGAIIRFLVANSRGWVSVYLDGYNMLGGVRGEAYWEVYDGEDIERFKIGESEQMMARIEEKLK